MRSDGHSDAGEPRRSGFPHPWAAQTPADGSGAYIEVGAASTEELRRRCFGDSDDAVNHSLVRRKIAWFITRRVYPHSVMSREDIFQEAHMTMWRRFSHVVEGFRQSGRVQTVENFERWLHTSIGLCVADVVRRERIQGRERAGGYDLSRVEAQSPPTVDEDRERTVSQWMKQALESLDDSDRRLLHGRLSKGKSCEELAAEFGLSPKVVSRRIYRAKLRFRGTLIRSAVSRCIARRPLGAEKPDHRAVIEGRCKLGNMCCMYRIDCPKARSPEELARELRGGDVLSLSTVQVTEALESLASAVRDGLDDWDLGMRLDSCEWTA